MENTASLLFRHFWVVAIGINVFNSWIVWRRVQKHIRENPDLAPGYRKIVNGYAFWSSIPWLIMGIGILEGGIPHLFYFFRPADGNPYVLAYWAAMFLIYGVAAGYWLFRRDGIEMLIRHPGLSYRRPLLNTRRGITIRWSILVASLVVMFALLYWFDWPVEDFLVIS